MKFLGRLKTQEDITDSLRSDSGSTASFTHKLSVTTALYMRIS